MVKATQSIGPLRPISSSANEQVARLIVERISRTPPYRMSLAGVCDRGNHPGVERRRQEAMMQKSLIWITSINPPIDGVVWHGTAESADGQMYRWSASVEHWKRETAHCFRKDDREWWVQEKAPVALYCAVRAAILAAAH